MNWRFLLEGLKKTCTNQFMRLNEKGKIEQTTKLLKSLSMESARKMQKFTPEECELIININNKGACSFDMVSKIESVCDEQTMNFCAVKEGEESIYVQRNGVDEAKVEQCQSDVKDVGDIVARIPPTWQYVALDCEFVGVDKDISALGRCSIVSYEGEVICDIYAKPVMRITNYRTRWSGITKKHMERAIPLESALSQISDIIQDKIVVGHGIHNDFNVLGLTHPEHLIRDTQKSKHLLMKMQQDYDVKQCVSLKRMAYTFLGETIQTGSHCSVIDATASMKLYKLVREEWETSLLQTDRQPNDGSDPDQSFNNTTETMDTEKESTNQEQSSYIDKMLTFTKTLNGKIIKKKKRNKKSSGFRAHFGQIIAGNKSLTDYFKADQILLKERNNELSDFIKNKFSVNIQNGKSSDSDNAISVSEEVSVPVLDDTDDVSSPLPLGDSKTNPSATISVCRNGRGQSSSEKFHMKTQYAHTIKQLFHDQFWEDLPLTAGTDTDSGIESVEK